MSEFVRSLNHGVPVPQLQQSVFRHCFAVLLLWIPMIGVASVSVGQGPVVIGPGGKPMMVQAGQRPGGAPSAKGKPADGKKKDDGKKDSSGDKKDDGESPDPKVIRRDETLSDKSDPDELNATVGDDGRVSFEFRNQPWVELVQWLADISNQPLDWLELPGDRVNMRSPGRYTVEETRDLFNRYLLARGYTLLEVDGGLTIAKTENINPAIVPRVSEAKLHTLQPYSFVRASLDVGWLSAEKLATELAPMISSNGKLTALTTTNRLEAMDAAINLRQISQLMEDQRGHSSREALAPEFKLRYLPAEEAKEMLEQFLGVEKKQKAAPMSAQQMQMMQQMRNQNKGAKPAEKKVEISIVANTRLNSVIIRAPADRLAVAMEFLKRIDLPSDSMVSLADIHNRVQVFRLASLDPEKLIEIVNELNVLEPTTRVRVDKENNALIVSGSAADRYVIDSMIKRLDGSGRKFEVLPLRRLDAAGVAESISFLMGQKDEDKNSNQGRRSYYYGFGGGNQEEKKKTDEFRVSANTRYRQVLLWANEQEMAEVRSLLVKLGELPPPGGSRQTVRIIDASATPETLEYLRRLKLQWNRISPNPLELPKDDQFKEPNHRPANSEEDKGNAEKDEKNAEEGDEKKDADKEKPNGKEMTEDTLANDSDLGSEQNLATYQLTVMQKNGPQNSSSPADTTPNDSESNQDSPAAPPVIRSSEDFDRAFRKQAPVRDPGQQPTAGQQPTPGQPSPALRIEIDAAGNLILTCPDTKALDQLENLMLQFKPPKRPYHVFHIEHASASWMRLNLEDYFEDMEDSEDSDADSFFRYYWGSGDEEKDDGPSGLGKGNKMRFVDDLDTNTLVINGATSEQLRTIAELIELWDVPEPVNKRKARFTRLLNVTYGKADKIADTVKEAYRDLLSSNDKAFGAGKGQGPGGDKSGGPQKSRGGSGSSFQNDSGRDGGGTDFSFRGKLSIGVDAIGNTLLVSAEGEPLLELVADMIRQLDEAAKPQGEIQVITLPGRINARSLQGALQLMGTAAGSNPTPSGGAGRIGKTAVTPAPAGKQ